MKRNRLSAEDYPAPSRPASTRDRPQTIGPESINFGSESPARALQGVLASRISDGFSMEAEEHVVRWPRHQRLLFLVGSASALWAVTLGLASIVSAVVR